MLGTEEKVNGEEQPLKMNAVENDQLQTAWFMFEEANAHFIENELEEATDLYSQVLAGLVPYLGQLHKSLGPVYTAYGRALLKLSTLKQQDDFLSESYIQEKKPAMLSILQPDSKRSKLIDLEGVADPSFDVEEAPESSLNNSDVEDDSDIEGKKVDDSTDGPENQETTPDDNFSGAEENDEDDGENDLELAWQILDIARIIYSDSEQDKSILSEIYCDLGDVSMEGESFKMAAEEFWKAVEIKQSLGESQERSLASTYFKMAIALELDNRVGEAVEPLTKALKLLQSRLSRLTFESNDGGRKVLNSQESVLKEDHTCSSTINTFAVDNGITLDTDNTHLSQVNNATDSEEVLDLRQLIPEVRAKLEEASSQAKNGTSSCHFGPTIASAAVNAAQDLSSLVKKRPTAS